MSKNIHLVIGLVAALGTPNRDLLKKVIQSFCTLHQFEFDKIKISDQFNKNEAKSSAKDCIQELDRKIKEGDKKRTDNKNNAICIEDGLKDKSWKIPTVLLIDQLKHAKEWECLKDKFGENKTILLGLYSSEKNRRSHLKKQAKDKSSENMALLEKLIIKDQYGYKEDGEHSQQVGEFFKEAHAFVDMDTSAHSIELQIHRILELLHGNNTMHSPTRDEYVMALARIVSYRSAELGRQVGAVISTDRGEILAAAPNEISHYPGEVYFDTIEGPPAKDNREKSGEGDYGKAKLNSMKSLFTEKEYSLQKEWVENIIEFMRATHAEEQAICTSAKLGISIKDALLYSTTYPCHHCARKIISSGIKEVIFIEPYPKSLAMEMFNSQITYNRCDSQEKVWFRPLIGIAPKLYSKVFHMREKKCEDDGKIKTWSPELVMHCFEKSDQNRLEY